MSQTAARLLSLLSLIQGNRAWTGSELAEHLDVSSRTVRHDIERLRELGYVVDGSRGSEGGYRLGAGGSALPPILLDADEATAVVVGLRTGLNCIIGGMEETSVRALAKLEKTLPAHLRHRVRNLSHYTVALPSHHPMPVVEPALLTQVTELCHRRERLRFRYQGDVVTKDIEPYRLLNRKHRWYVLGYDIEADDWATFEVEKIEPLTPSGPRFTARELHDEDVAAFVAERHPEIRWRHTALVTLHVSAEDVAGQVMPAEGVVEPVDADSCSLRVGAESLDTIALVLARLDVEFTIVDHEPLADAVRLMGERLQRSSAHVG